MATTAEPTSATRRTLPPLPTGKSARDILEPPPDLRGRLIRLLVVVAAFALLALGWNVTGIDFLKLVGNAPNAQHILRGLVTPDVLTKEVISSELAVPVRVGAATTETAPVVAADGGRSLIVSPPVITPGEYVKFEATGYGTQGTGQLRIEGPNNFNQKLQDVVIDGGALKLMFQGEMWDNVEFLWPAEGTRGSVPAGDYRVVLTMASQTGNWVLSDTFKLVLSRIGETILLALMGTALGLVISVPMSFFGAQNLMKGTLLGEIVYTIVRTIFNLTRSIEILILAVIMAVIVGIGSFAGVMAIVLHSIGAMGKLYSEAIESIDTGPIEAVRATGASQFQTVLFAVVPQIVPTFLSFTMYRWDINVRMSTVLGLVGGGGIGFVLQQYMNLLQWSQAATALWMIAIVVISMDYLSAYIRAKLV